MLVVSALAGLAVAGCGSLSSHGAGMMGDGGQSTDAGMMSGARGYHFARATCSPPRSLPGHVIDVTLADRGMTRMMGGTAPMGAQMTLRTSAATVSAGQISLVASNRGWRTHELVILKLAPGATAGRRVPASDGKVAETSSLGEASRSCGSRAGDGITSGSVGWTTLTLAPGRYELICNLPNHYTDGMYEQLIVT
jgi:uncharacterized cupredoxin-like copper-binding protein